MVTKIVLLLIGITVCVAGGVYLYGVITDDSYPTFVRAISGIALVVVTVNLIVAATTVASKKQ